MMIDGQVSAAVLGATGVVGQQLVRLLSDHPWLRPVELLASEDSAGERYLDAANWMLDEPLPDGVASTRVRAVGARVESDLVFSALPSGIARAAEDQYADAGRLVVTNAKDHRMDPNVPLVVPEVNADHLALAHEQDREGDGRIVANPNCSAVGLVLALAPLMEDLHLSDVNVVSMQALSGAGVPGVASLEIQDNVIPLVAGEEEKLKREPHKILGDIERCDVGGGLTVEPASIRVSPQCNRVAVSDGHLQSVSLRFGDGAHRPVDLDGLRELWNGYSGLPQELGLPSAPECPVRHLEGKAVPQPRRHRGAGRGMTVTVGRLQRCAVHDVRFVTLSHNTVRGAAGGAILIAETVQAVDGAIVASGPGRG